MAETLITVAVKFIEQGGLYALLGLFVLMMAAGGLVTAKLFNAYAAAQEARISENRALAERAITALETVKTSIDAATKAAEVNAGVSEANRSTIESFRETLEALMRALLDRRRH
jgi:hypothetical protein